MDIYRMILYKAIRYLILDMCLDSFFNSIKKNLKHNTKNRIVCAKDIPHGTCIRLMRMNGEEIGKIFENCEVFKSIIHGKSNGGGLYCEGLGIIDSWLFDDDAPMIEILEY